MELTEEQKITMAVAYGRVHEARMRIAAEDVAISEEVIGQIESDDTLLANFISQYNTAWRKLTGFRPHHEEFAEVNG